MNDFLEIIESHEVAYELPNIAKTAGMIPGRPMQEALGSPIWCLGLTNRLRNESGK